MSNAVPLNSARRTVSIAAAAMADVDGIKTNFASVASPVTYVPADFNGGSGISSSTGVLSPLPRVVTISRSSAANQYSVNPIVVVGKRGGVTVTESLTPANDDGGDILATVSAFDSIISITKPADANTGGAYTIGFRDVCAPVGDRFTAVMVATTGNLVVQYGEASGSPTDTIPAVADHVYPIAPYRIVTGAGGTAVGATVFLP